MQMITSLLSESVIIAFQKSCTQVSTGSAVLILKCFIDSLQSIKLRETIDITLFLAE